VKRNILNLGCSFKDTASHILDTIVCINYIVACTVPATQYISVKPYAIKVNGEYEDKSHHILV
jgi:hypothetical protein